MENIRDEMWKRAEQRLWNQAAIEASQGIWNSFLFQLEYSRVREEIYG